MVPRKIKPGKARLGELIEEYKISFDGPLLPQSWPERYQNLFMGIRKISEARYNDYIGTCLTNSAERNRLILKTRERVRRIRERVRASRKGTKTNESTWRSRVETDIRNRFTESAVCNRCGDERWTPEYLAKASREVDIERVNRKRRGRKACQCFLNNHDHNQNLANEVLGESDEEDRDVVFEFVADTQISQESDPTLQTYSIPMKPDLVIGLRKTQRYTQYLPACPADAKPTSLTDLMYPFMVFEAKREGYGDGFQGIENQTAFALNRLLKEQERLCTTSGIQFDPLVWFFGYQGDVWRLYAAITEESTVRVIDLWLGGIASHDGALQLVHILDYIWTWARDIYCPWIRRSLRTFQPHPELFSATSSDYLSRGGSLTSERGHYPDLLGTHNIGQARTPNDMELTIIETDSNVEDWELHPLFRFISAHDMSTAWAAQTRTRHSDVVLFSFKLFELPSQRTELEKMINVSNEPTYVGWDLSWVFQQQSPLIPIKRGSILTIHNVWTRARPSRPLQKDWNPNEVVGAIFYFHTFIQPENWQITRELCCVIWTWPAIKTLSDINLSQISPSSEGHWLTIPLDIVIQEIRRVHSLSGIASVEYAYNETSLILSRVRNQPRASRPLSWRPIPEQKSFAVTRVLQRTKFQVTSSKPLWIRRSLVTLMEVDELPFLSTRVVESGAVMLVRPKAWNRECARFCLFILEDGEIDGSQLRDMLGKAKLLQSDDACEALFRSPNTRHILRSWMKALESFA